MKKTYYLFALLLLGFSSCKDYLETTPTDFLSPSTYYQNEAQLNAARSSVYETLRSGSTYSSQMLYQLANDGDVGFENHATLIGTYDYSYSSADAVNRSFYTAWWSGINKCNVVIANVDRNQAIAKDFRDRLRGETLFLRGYYYFMLVQYYGSMPIKLVPTSDIVNVDIPRPSLKENYDQILKDMEAAEALVPGIVAAGNGGLVNKSAVRGILARVNLTMAGEPLKDKTRYAQASKWAKMVMDDAQVGHVLNPYYPQVFMNLAADKYDIKESIWEVEFQGNGLDLTNNTGSVGERNGVSCPAVNPTGRSDAYMYITANYYNSYEPGDDRLWFNVCLFTYPNSATAVYAKKNLSSLPANEGAKNSLFPAKYRREYETFRPKNAGRTPINNTILRFADVLLMYAEAENEINNGPTAAAIAAVNKVRQRGWSRGVKAITITNGGTGYTSTPTVTFSGGGSNNAKPTYMSVAGQASGKATISGGKVTGITLNRDSAAIKYFEDGVYTSPPIITISGGGGSGATASATIWTPADGDLKLAQKESKSAFLAMLQDERMRELGFESVRKPDLLRWGIFLVVMGDMANQLSASNPGTFMASRYGNATAKDVLMAIPNTEISANLTFTQNPGWK